MQHINKSYSLPPFMAQRDLTTNNRRLDGKVVEMKRVIVIYDTMMLPLAKIIKVNKKKFQFTVD